MLFFNRLTAVVLTAVLLGPVASLEAKARKADKYLLEGRAHEAKQEWDEALKSYEQALSEDPSETVYQLAVQKARFEAGQMHVDRGLKTRLKGLLGDALVEFQKAYAINPGSTVAEQEIRRTQEMIQRERQRVEQTGKESSPEQRALTPVDELRRETQRRFDRMLPVPELKPLNTAPINLKINGQTAKVLFETVGKVAGINVLWDPEYQTQAPQKPLNVDLQNATLEEALDYLAVMTKSFWKPLSPNTIFITIDNPNKRRDYAEMVTQVFYLTNVNSPQELAEIVTAVRAVAETQRIVAYNSQNAIIVRGEADQVALAEKIIRDLDKPRSEVVIDILVLEASTVFTRQITAALASTGLNVPVNFTPRSGLQVVNNANTTGTTGTTTTDTSTSTPTGTTTGTTSSTSGSAIPLSNLGHLASSDFSTTLPGALLQAALSDTKTKVLQAPQVRTVDNMKASLKIGEKQPTASGSFQPGIGGVGINPLVNTQFQYLDVGVNVELQSRVHDNGDVSLHVDIDISSVTGSVNLGGISQPIIGQRHVQQDIRLRQGEVGLVGGLLKQQDSKQITGIPGLSSIPVIKRLFSGESVDRERDEILIVLVPHVVRRPDYTASNLKAVAVGNATTIRLNYAPEKPDIDGATVQPGSAAVTPPAPPATAPPLAPSVVPAPNAPGQAVPTPVPGLTIAAPPATAPPATAPPATAPAAPADNVHVRFLPSQIDTNVSGGVTAALSLDGAADVASAPMQIQFDPKILRLNDVVRGELLSADGQQPIFTKNIQNDSGTATIQLSRLPGSPRIGGSGILVTLNFQAVARGSTVVSIPNLTIRNSAGQVVTNVSPMLPVNVK